jgi:O-succinylbenzoic acid--CoA ligase
MTETAAMIAAQRPEEFLAGARNCGTVMSHAHVTVDPADGVLSVSGASVFRGYWPELRASREFTTDDIGRMDERGQLHVLGRRDAMIITGGKKVQPADVEAVLRASGQFDDVAVIGVTDDEWGEAVVACYPAAAARPPDFNQVEQTTGRLLATHQRPKRFVAIADWPRNAQGKVNRTALRAQVVGEGKAETRILRPETGNRKPET